VVVYNGCHECAARTPDGAVDYKPGVSNLLTVEQTAKRLGIGKSTLYRTWRDLGLPAYYVGNRLRFRDTELETWIDSQRAA
jgi:excisionase family DNA binding protein